MLSTVRTLNISDNGCEAAVHQRSNENGMSEVVLMLQTGLCMTEVYVTEDKQ